MMAESAPTGTAWLLVPWREHVGSLRQTLRDVLASPRPQRGLDADRIDPEAWHRPRPAV